MPKNFGVHFGLRIFRFLAFGFHFSSKLPNGFRFFLIEFRLLFDLSGNYAPPLISNSCETFVRSKSLFTPLATTASDRLITGMWKVIGFDGSECGFRFDRIFWRFLRYKWFFLRWVLWFLIELNVPLLIVFTYTSAFIQPHLEGCVCSVNRQVISIWMLWITSILRRFDIFFFRSRWKNSNRLRGPRLKWRPHAVLYWP